MSVLTVYPSKTPIDSYTTENTPADDSIYDVNWQGQIFTAPTSDVIKSVDLQLWKDGTPGTLYVEIRTISGGLPTATVLASGTYNGNTLPDGATNRVWVNISLGAGATVVASTQYAILAYTTGGDASNRVRWRVDQAGGYTGGSQVYSSNGGTSFTTSGSTAIDNTFKIYGNTVDGSLERQTASQTLANIVAGAGTGAGSTADSMVCAYLKASTTNDEYQDLLRGIFTFDTSALPDDATISAVTLNLYVYNSLDDLAVTSFNVVGSTPASDNALVAADYGQLGTTKLSADVAIAGIGTGYKAITLNAAGLAAISKTGITKLGTRLTADGLSGGITWGSEEVSYVGIQTAEYAGRQPYLEITYSVGITYDRALSDSIMNAASRLATVGRIATFGRSISDSILNGASRLATVVRVGTFYRTLSTTISVSASLTFRKLATVIEHIFTKIRNIKPRVLKIKSIRPRFKNNRDIRPRIK